MTRGFTAVLVIQPNVGEVTLGSVGNPKFG